MAIKIKDKYYSFDSKNNSIMDFNYFLQCSDAKDIGDNDFEVEPSIINFKRLYKIVKEKQQLKDYFKFLIDKRKKEKDSKFSKYNFLYNFQKKGIDKIINSNQGGFILSFEQGLGKTLTSLVTCEIKNESNVWIVAPASLLAQWKEEINKWLGQDAIIYRGTPTQRKKLYSIKSKYNIISYETLRKDYKDINELKNHISNCFMIFDESTKLKNKGTKLYKSFKDICKRVKFKLFMTGTPVNNKLQDIDNVVRLISPNIVDNVNNYIIWEQRTAGWGHSAKMWMEQVGYKNLDRYIERIKPIYFRTTKEQAAPYLPKKNIIRIDIEQTKQHMAIKKGVIESLSPFTGFTLLKLLDCGLEVFQKSNSETAELFEDDIPKSISNPKLDTLVDIIEEVNNQVIIFSGFKESCNLIALRLEKEFKDKKIAIVTSETKNKEDIANKFRQKKIDIVIATNTWAKGISFSDIDYLIYYDIPTSYETYFQIQDRIHRVNSKTPKFIYNLVGDVIENHIMDLLEEKVKVTQQITEGKGEQIRESELKLEVTKLLGWS